MIRQNVGPLTQSFFVFSVCFTWFLLFSGFLFGRDANPVRQRVLSIRRLFGTEIDAPPSPPPPPQFTLATATLDTAALSDSFGIM